ncbi:MAG: hypothetical protein K2W96_04705 [Gemmataceae bacterium]|nr:hypothetical protein [Gemmataceae bacterium]
MSRRSFFVALGVLALLVLVGLAAAWLLLRYEPRYYAKLLPGTEKERSEQSAEFVREFFTFLSAVQGQKEWYGRFTEEQVNSYLAVGLEKHWQAGSPFPEGVSEPRLVFEPGRIRVAFRYKKGLLDSVVSVSLKVWVPRDEPSALCVQLEYLKAGLLPLSAQWLLDSFEEKARANRIDVSWYRHDGLPVALLRFQTDKAKPTIRLETAKVEQGAVVFAGTTNDPRGLASRK